jgi:GT2 family glycosyltransferase
VLNYHHPGETLACVGGLLEREPDTTRILWIENDAALTWNETKEMLDSSGLPYQVLDPAAFSLPPGGMVGVILNAENLGFAGGNNVGLRWLHQLSVPYAWVLNNDTLVLHGNSEALVKAAEDRPEVGAWGTPILTTHAPCYFGGIVSERDFSIKFAQTPQCLETDPMSFVSGCSLFIRTSVAAEVGFIPEHYFLYYEDPSFGCELRKAGYTLSGVWGVLVFHIESLSTGRRSSLMEFYNRRNRWYFIQRYFPDHLSRQKRRIWYRIQKWIFRARFDRIHIEILAYLDFRKGRLGRTQRVFSRRLSK